MVISKTKITAFVLAWLSLLLLCSPIFAQESTGQAEGAADTIELLEEAKNNIVCVESICWNGDNLIYRRKSYTGTVISEDNNTLYIVTIQAGLEYSDLEKQEIRQEYELKDTDRLQEKIEIVFQGDLRIQASIVGDSEQRNLTVLKLNQAIQFDNLPEFENRDAEDGEEVYLLGYLEQAAEGGENYYRENVAMTAGRITATYRLEEITFHQHGIQANPLATGGTLYDAKGRIIGILQSFPGEEEGTAISCSEIKNFLKTFKVPYEEYEEPVIKKKAPILNYILAVIILVLLILLIHSIAKENREQKRAGNSSFSQPYESLEKASHKKKHSRKDKGVSQNQAYSSIEYPSARRMAVISKSPFLIGRSERADFVIDEVKGISREHACISSEGGNFFVSDLGSTNHTYVNGVEVEQGENRPLHSGDEIMLGKETLIFSIKS